MEGNRKEAGAALSHIAGSGKDAHNLVQSFSRVCKKVRDDYISFGIRVLFAESHRCITLDSSCPLA
jgi:hypothetical protein